MADRRDSSATLLWNLKQLQIVHHTHRCSGAYYYLSLVHYYLSLGYDYVSRGHYYLSRGHYYLSRGQYYLSLGHYYLYYTSLCYGYDDC